MGLEPLAIVNGFVFYALLVINSWFFRLIKINSRSSKAQLSHCASSVLINADTAELSVCQKCRQTAFQLYIAELEIVVGHWPFSDQFSPFGPANPICLAKFNVHFQWESH